MKLCTKRITIITAAIPAVLMLALSPPANAGVTTRDSVSSDGTQGNWNSYYPSISADGRYVAFYSWASNLVPGTTNGIGVFVHDRQTGVTERVSVSSDGTQGNNNSFSPSISADGRFVAFTSLASNLVIDDTNGELDVFVHDRQTGVTERVSVSSDGTQGNDSSGYHELSISADGRYVAFASYASNLVPGDTNGPYPGSEDVFVYDRQTGVTERVSVSSDGTQGNTVSNQPSISADGRFVAFTSCASNLVTVDTNGYPDIFVHDRQTGVTERVSVPSDGTQGNLSSYHPSINADGRFVVFESYASNLIPGDTNSSPDIFVHDRQTGITEGISVASDSTQGNLSSYHPSINADGRFVAFYSWASNLVAGDTNVHWDVFVHDRWGVQDTKALPDGSTAILSGNTATAGLPGAFYAEDADRSSGIRVSWSGSVTQGDRYHVDGTLVTNSDGERYIDAWNVRRIDTLPVSPLGMPMQFLGGSDKDYDEITGGGQQGITDAFGLNNIGLLITTWGKVTQTGADYLYIDDGSNLKDGTLTDSEENVGVRVICDPAGYTSGDIAEVTGISSCFQTPSGNLARRILTRNSEDIRRLSP